MTESLAAFVAVTGRDGVVTGRASVTEALDQDVALRKDVERVEQALEKVPVEKDEISKPEQAAKPNGQLIAKEEVAKGRIGWEACEFSSDGDGIQPLTCSSSHVLLLQIRWYYLLDHLFHGDGSHPALQDRSSMVPRLLGSTIRQQTRVRRRCCSVPGRILPDRRSRRTLLDHQLDHFRTRFNSRLKAHTSTAHSVFVGYNNPVA